MRRRVTPSLLWVPLIMTLGSGVSLADDDSKLAAIGEQLRADVKEKSKNLLEEIQSVADEIKTVAKSSATRQEKLEAYADLGKRVMDQCQKVIAREKEIKRTFVELKISCKAMVDFLKDEEKELLELAESPPDSEGLSSAQLEELKGQYELLARQVHLMQKPYDEKFHAVEGQQDSAMAQLASIKDYADVLAQSLAAIELLHGQNEMAEELKKLETNLGEMNDSLDQMLDLFVKMAESTRATP